MTFNKNIKMRDEIIFGGYLPDKYLGGIRYFDGMSAETLEKLIELRFADPEETQNSSPTIREFLDYMNGRDDYRLNGYAVSDKRSDYRVSIEAIERYGTIEDVEEAKEFAAFAHWADEFDPDGYAWWD